MRYEQAIGTVCRAGGLLCWQHNGGLRDVGAGHRTISISAPAFASQPLGKAYVGHASDA